MADPCSVMKLSQFHDFMISLLIGHLAAWAMLCFRWAANFLHLERDLSQHEWLLGISNNFEEIRLGHGGNNDEGLGRRRNTFRCCCEWNSCPWMLSIFCSTNMALVRTYVRYSLFDAKWAPVFFERLNMKQDPALSSVLFPSCPFLANDYEERWRTMILSMKTASSFSERIKDTKDSTWSVVRP